MNWRNSELEVYEHSVCVCVWGGGGVRNREEDEHSAHSGEMGIIGKTSKLITTGCSQNAAAFNSYV